MDSLKGKLLEEMLKHLDNSQGMGLKEAYDTSMKFPHPDMDIERVPPAPGEEPLDIEAVEEPKGLKMKSVEIMAKKPEDMELEKVNDPIASAMGKSGDMGMGDMSEDELEELLKGIL